MNKNKLYFGRGETVKLNKDQFQTFNHSEVVEEITKVIGEEPNEIENGGRHISWLDAGPLTEWGIILCFDSQTINLFAYDEDTLPALDQTFNVDLKSKLEWAASELGCELVISTKEQI
tara:strand:- start:219 stop:572 length:354 start_codon:yes stop_codon:yes gene_type:complete